jgi:hypothetical protein
MKVVGGVFVRFSCARFTGAILMNEEGDVKPLRHLPTIRALQDPANSPHIFHVHLPVALSFYSILQSAFCHLLPMGLLLPIYLNCVFNNPYNKYFLRPYSFSFLTWKTVLVALNQFSPILPSSVLVQSPYCTTGATGSHML